MLNVLCLLWVVCGVFSQPLNQPVYSVPQYADAQALTTSQQPQQQPQYISIPPIPQPQTHIYANPPRQVPQQQQYDNGPPTQVVSQLLLPTNVDRQIQKAAQQIAGPDYARQLQAVQQQGLANQAVATAQRQAQAQARRQQQQIRAAQQQIQDAQQQLLASQLVLSHQPQPQPQAQAQTQYQLQYQPQYQAPVTRPRPTQRPTQPQVFPSDDEQSNEADDGNSSYQFGFDVTDDLNTNYQNRKEQRDGNKISGSYSVVDSDGFLRTVTYTADPKEGFKAEVVRKPTDIVVKVPTPSPSAKNQYDIPSGNQEKGNVIYQY